MPTLVKPKRGEDVRVLHRSVRDLVEGINTLAGMIATWDDSTAKGVGTLAIKGDKSELLITTQSTGDGGINPPPTTVTLISSRNPSPHGVAVIFTAGVPTPIVGTITFYIDDAVYATVAVASDGTASAPGIDTLTSEDHAIAAYYTGDHPPGVAYLTQHVNEKLDPAMGFITAPNPAGNHAQVEFLATLPTDATGTVIFYVDGFSLGVVNVVSGVAQLLTVSGTGLLTPGTHGVAAGYSGDETYNNKTVGGVLVVSPQSGSTVQVVSNNNPAATTESITWGAEVYPNPTTPTIMPTGTVQFYIEGSSWGAPATLVPHPASGYSFATSVPTPAPNALSVGENDVSAEYSGDTNYFPATGDMVQIVLVVTDISVDCIDDEPIVGVDTKLICHAPKVEGFAPPTGNVDFLIAGAYRDSGFLHGTNPPEPPGMQVAETGNLVFNTSGSTMIRAEYEGDGTYAGVFEEHNIHVYALATGFSFDWFGYITGSGETIAVAWYFNLLTPSSQRTTPVQIRVLEALWAPGQLPFVYGGYPVATWFNTGWWLPTGNRDQAVAEIFMTATGSGGVAGTNVQVLLDVGFGDGHTAANLIGTGSTTLWTQSTPSRLVLTASFANLP